MEDLPMASNGALPIPFSENEPMIMYDPQITTQQDSLPVPTKASLKVFTCDTEMKTILDDDTELTEVPKADLITIDQQSVQDVLNDAGALTIENPNNGQTIQVIVLPASKDEDCNDDEQSMLQEEFNSNPSDKAHNCHTCGASFYMYLELLRHVMAAHSRQLPAGAVVEGHQTVSYNPTIAVEGTTEVVELFECSECGLHYRNVSDLNDHLVEHMTDKMKQGDTESVPLTPPTQGPVTPTTRSTPGKVYACNACDKTFTRSFSLKNHMLIHTGEKPHECELCGKAFREATKLNTHLKTHSDIKPHVCPVCAKAFSVQAYLRTHMMIHTGKKPYTCKVCHVAFASSGNLKRHTRIHTGEKPYSCDFCGVSFAQMGNLESHKRTHTGVRPYDCEICGKAFMQSSGLVEHIRTHSGVKPYSCDVCGRSFAGSSGLRVHKRTHTGEKPHECHICLKRFCASGNLKTHMKIHLGVKPFTCDYCGKGFGASGNLTQHVRVHTGEKPYNCKLCGKTFSGNGGLKIHMMGHYGERPFPCEHCDKSFKTAQKQKAHFRVHTGERPFQCTLCDKNFIVSEKLKVHLRTKHMVGLRDVDKKPKIGKIKSTKTESSAEPPPLSPEIGKSTSSIKVLHDPYSFDADEAINVRIDDDDDEDPPNLGSPMVSIVTDPLNETETETEAGQNEEGVTTLVVNCGDGSVQLVGHI